MESNFSTSNLQESIGSVDVSKEPRTLTTSKEVHVPIEREQVTFETGATARANVIQESAVFNIRSFSEVAAPARVESAELQTEGKDDDVDEILEEGKEFIDDIAHVPEQDTRSFWERVGGTIKEGAKKANEKFFKFDVDAFKENKLKYTGKYLLEIAKDPKRLATYAIGVGVITTFITLGVPAAVLAPIAFGIAQYIPFAPFLVNAVGVIIMRSPFILGMIAKTPEGFGAISATALAAVLGLPILPLMFAGVLGGGLKRMSRDIARGKKH